MEQTPYWADLLFPVLAFLLTIVGPVLVALWVIFRVATDKKLYVPEPGADGAPKQVPSAKTP